MKKILFAILALALVATVATSCCPNSCEASPAEPPVERASKVAEGDNFKVYEVRIDGATYLIAQATGGAVTMPPKITR